MTFDEKLAMHVQSIELEKQGKYEEATRLARSIPMEPWMAAWWKKYMGVEPLIAGGWNLSEAEEAFRHDWLSR
jgi:hypothetical protein